MKTLFLLLIIFVQDGYPQTELAWFKNEAACTTAGQYRLTQLQTAPLTTGQRGSCIRVDYRPGPDI